MAIRKKRVITARDGTPVRLVSREELLGANDDYEETVKKYREKYGRGFSLDEYLKDKHLAASYE